MTIVDTSKNSGANNMGSEKADSIDKGGRALAAAVGQPVDDEYDDEIENDDTSTASTVDLRKFINAEVAPPKSLVIIWVLMAAELGFDLITTAIAFASTMGNKKCCKYTVYMGPLPMTTSIPFFFLIIAEITFLIRAILLTLWPSIFEKARVAAHETEDEKDFEDDQIGFEVCLTKTNSESTEEVNEINSSDDDTHGEKDPKNKTEKDTEIDTDPEIDADKETDKDISTDVNEVATDDEDKTTSANTNDGSSQEDIDCVEEDDDDTKGIRVKNDPEFVKTKKAQNKSGFLKRVFCGFLKWNARMVLTILNLLTLANPFFGCLIAYILLYTSDKKESFVVLIIESLSIILHFVSVRMEGGLRTWWSKLLHSVALLPFLVTVILVLVFLREGGICYNVENQLFRFSGCEICPDTLEPPINGLCGNSTIEGIGGFRNELSTVSGSFESFEDLKNIATIIERGADQDEYCSETINFCFFEF